MASNQPKSNLYETPLTPDEEAAFQTWKKQYAPKDSGADYDLRGAFKAGIKPDKDRGHFPDIYKKPNHPTFSVESQYSTKDTTGGRWQEQDGKTTFVPSPHNLTQYPPEALTKYFKSAEPDSVLQLPPPRKQRIDALELLDPRM